MRKGDFDVYSAQLDGTHERAILTDDVDQAPQTWARDGRRLVVQEWHDDGSRPVTLIEPGPGGARNILVAGVGPSNARLSPGDRWLAYDSRRSNRAEVYVQPFPGAGPAVRVSARGGTTPQLAPLRNELFYRRGDEFLSVNYGEDHGRFMAGPEKTVLRLPSFHLAGVHPDGRRFLLTRRAEPEPTSGIRVALNWLEELKTRVPTK